MEQAGNEGIFGEFYALGGDHNVRQPRQTLIAALFRCYWPGCVGLQESHKHLTRSLLTIITGHCRGMFPQVLISSQTARRDRGHLDIQRNDSSIILPSLTSHGLTGMGVGSFPYYHCAMARTRKKAQIHPDTSLTIHDVSIPESTHPSQILIKIAISVCNL